MPSGKMLVLITEEDELHLEDAAFGSSPKLYFTDHVFLPLVIMMTSQYYSYIVGSPIHASVLKRSTKLQAWYHTIQWQKEHL